MGLEMLFEVQVLIHFDLLYTPRLEETQVEHWLAERPPDPSTQDHLISKLSATLGKEIYRMTVFAPEPPAALLAQHPVYIEPQFKRRQ